MTLDLTRVKERFQRFSGETPGVSPVRDELCAQLCEECAAKAQALWERSGKADTGKAQNALESWAAARAFYQLALADEATSPESVTADGLRLEAGERSRKALALAEEKGRELSLELGEGAFYFGVV